ncbi:MAG: Plug domain-containing protein, partial [Elusimicrobia bacterium]|nr:Plug domain-containing protein [Elusimicrobiota bacterium]
MRKVFAVSCVLLVSSCMSAVFGFEEVKFDSGTAFITLTRKLEKTENLLTNIAVVKANQYSTVSAHNAGQLLQSLPSIDISPIGSIGSQTTARIRNSTSDQVLVLVNGLPTKGNSLGSDNLAHLLTDNIERVEVVYGPASVLYG